MMVRDPMRFRVFRCINAQTRPNGERNTQQHAGLKEVRTRLPVNRSVYLSANFTLSMRQREARRGTLYGPPYGESVLWPITRPAQARSEFAPREVAMNP